MSYLSRQTVFEMLQAVGYLRVTSVGKYDPKHQLNEHSFGQWHVAVVRPLNTQLTITNSLCFELALWTCRCHGRLCYRSEKEEKKAENGFVENRPQKNCRGFSGTEKRG